MQRTTILVLLLAGSLLAKAQSVTGSWYGRADVEVQGNFSNYLTELVLKQKGDEVEGIFGYYFKDSYQSFFIRGKYDSKTRQVSILNLPMLHYGASTRNGIECPMHFMGTLMVSQVSSSLKGFFYTDDKYKYTCPEMRVTLLMDAGEKNQDSILRNTVAGKKLWQPQEEDLIVSAPANGEAAVTTRAATESTIEPEKAVSPAISDNDQKKLIEKFEKRKNTFLEDLPIEGDSVRLSFYDNGDIDGDSISVFLNNQPVLARQEISSRALNIYLALDKSRDVNEVSMLAENLGRFPPNTALMIVTDGVHRYEVYLSSSLTQNAAIRLIRKKTANSK